LQTLDWRCAFTVEYSSSPVSGLFRSTCSLLCYW